MEATVQGHGSIAALTVRRGINPPTPLSHYKQGHDALGRQEINVTLKRASPCLR